MTDHTYIHSKKIYAAACEAVSAELKRKRALNEPIAEFDPKSKKNYFVYGNGEKKLFGEAMQKWRYSERCKYRTE